ncbi:glycosyl transferase [Fistulina hepatica ATCC 64428]|uniref:Glycosyl transferase n=1 Tax=Fistulina hepatica ATCC 64428 TaxID=1128425 RepID=A0A0D7AGA0_9AGAR|nr:glycosyl transferase [Fistulina hepatica ATCC 64428]
MNATRRYLSIVLVILFVVVKSEDIEYGPTLANATFVILARNSDIDGVISSVKAIEDRFNRRYHYPYVFLNDEPFHHDFKYRLSLVMSGPAEFGQIPEEHWSQPDWIDENKASEARKNMVRKGVKYGGSVSYRNMCRFNSGFFYRHPLMQKYKYYWRIEPNVRFLCDIDFDPFQFMHDNGKIYSFTIAVYEIPATIASLWPALQDFMQKYPEYIMPESTNSMGFISSNSGKTYNRCHFWSNFEIADMDFYRGPAYSKYFEHLDKAGGFYYERWGDAPVHSIAASLFLNTSQLHFFQEIGYQHDDWAHCPFDREIWEKGKCVCQFASGFDYDSNSCKGVWDHFNVMRYMDNKNAQKNAQKDGQLSCTVLEA